jgi:ABC-type phosphate/phosphonate transport system substrate-binding protein
MGSYAAESVTCWFPPGWKNKGNQAKAIASALSKESGVSIRPQIARSYPQILTAFTSGKKALVYVGSFVQAIIHARKLGTPLVQNINGKDLYSGIMIYPKGKDPKAILEKYPKQFAFTVGASSGESSAKAATNGMAAIGVPNHRAAAGAVRMGKAKAGVVKNWWWESNKKRYPMLAIYNIPGISIRKNADNVLTASKSIPDDMLEKIKKAAIKSKEVFGAPEMVPFDSTRIDFSLDLMKKGKIDPLTYTWK